MITSIVKVEGMACEHCVNAVTKTVETLNGVSSVAVDLEAKTVTVKHDPQLVSLEKIGNEIEEQGYDVIR